MENLLFYFLKVNAILSLFYVVYYLLLRKETFFQANRLFLLGGIVSAFVIPLLSYSKVIWIEPTPINYNEFIPVNNSTENISAIPEVANFDWNFLFIMLYGLIVTILLAKVVVEVISFISVVKSGNKNKVNKVVLVETSLFENPFSFFNYLVYNKSVFTEEELEYILTHESIHIKQFHSIDVLIGKLTTLLLWINPIAWLYRKAMLQNLEFIADAETTKEFQNSYNYQKTLLKAVCNQNQLSITNQFYQSLIKKRIVMLNTNPSNKRNVWKYSVILPMLVAFFLLYQVKTVAQVKEEAKAVKTAVAVEVVQFLITKNTTDADIKKETETFKKEHGIDLKITKVKRNSSNEIIGLSISYKDKDGNTGQLSRKSDTPIEPILFYKELDKNDNGKISFGDQQMTDFATAIAFDEANELNTQSIGTIKTDKGEVIYIVNGKKYSQRLENLDIDQITVDGTIDSQADEDSDDKLIIFNGKSTLKNKNNTIIFLNDNEISEDEMKTIDTEIIKSVNVVKNGKNDEIKIITKNSTGIDEDTEIYINGVKSTKADLEALEKEQITSIDINKFDDKKIIEIQKKVMKEVDQKMKKMNYKFERKEDKPEKIIKIEKYGADMEERKVEMEKMKAELEKTKAELEKMKEELQKKK